MKYLGEHTSLETMREPAARCSTSVVVQQLADLEADPAAQPRLNKLVTKCNVGERTDGE